MMPDSLTNEDEEGRPMVFIGGPYHLEVIEVPMDVNRFLFEDEYGEVTLYIRHKISSRRYGFKFNAMIDTLESIGKLGTVIDDASFLMQSCN